MGCRLLRRFSTLRHGRGFGVHSPLAYELITAVLPDKPSYYADARINELSDDKRHCRIARILIRLIAKFKPERVYLTSEFADLPTLCGNSVRQMNSAENADFSLIKNDNRFVIIIKCNNSDCGPLILDNEKDLKIVIYRKGLSPTLINTTL